MIILSSTNQDGLAAALGYGTVLLALAAIVLIVLFLIKRFTAKTPVGEAPVEIAPVEEAELPLAPGSAGDVMLHDVPEKTAAMLMAIVADKLQKPLNELRFVSIKEVK